MAEDEPSGESSPLLTYRDDRETVTTDGGPEDISEQPSSPPTSTPHDSYLPKEPSEAPRRPAFLSCKWPEGSDWAVGLADELQALGLPVLHDARHRTKLHDVEELIKDSCCVVMLVTPGFFHGLANRPNGNRALKEVKLALQHGKPLVAAVHASYCGQNPLPALRSIRELTAGSDDGPAAWTSAELAGVAGAPAVLVFKGGEGFDAYQRELLRLVGSAAASAAGAPSGGEGRSGPAYYGRGSRSSAEQEAEEKRLRDVLRVAGLSKRLPGLQEGNVRTVAALESALQRGRLSAKPFNWPEGWIRRVAQVLESWPVLSSMPEWMRTAPEGLVPLLVPLLAQEEAREFDREGRPRPKRGAVPPVTALELGGQGPVVMGPRGGQVVAAMIRDVGSAAAAARRRDAETPAAAAAAQGEQPDGAAGAAGAAAAAPPPRLYGTAMTLLTLRVVDVSDCDLGTAVAGELVAAVGTCPSISTLLLGGNGIEDGIVQDITTMLRRTAFLGPPPTPFSAAAGGGGGNGGGSGPDTAVGGLRTLGLDRNQLTDKGAAALVTVLNDYPGSLTALDLSGNAGLGSATAEALARVLRAGGGQRLSSVGLMNTNMDEAAVATLLPALLNGRRRGSSTAGDGGSTDGAAAGADGASPVLEELDLSGTTVDADALAALAAAARQPGYGGGPRRLNLTGANLRVAPSSRRPTITAENGGHSGGAPGGGGGSGNVTALAAALLHSYNLEDLRLGWSGLSGAGLRILVSGLMVRPMTPPGGRRVPGNQPLGRLTTLDLTGNKLGPEGVSLLGALLPVNLPSLRHLVLEECGFGGRELGMLAGMLDVAPWVVDAVQGALTLILNDQVTGGVRGIWTEPPSEVAAERQRARQRAYGQGPEADASAASALAGLMRTWLAMDPSTAAAEVRRLMLPTPAAAAGSFASPTSFVARKAIAALTAGGPNKLVGLGCLLVHPVIQPVMEALRHTWEALQAEAADVAAVGGRISPLTLPLSTPESQSAFRALDATVVHLRGCGEVAGLESLSLGRNGFAQEAGAPLGAAIALSAGVRHISLRGIVQPAAPAPVAGTGAAAVAAATAAAQGGPLAAAAAAARDARALLRLLYPSAAAAVEGPSAGRPQTPPSSASPPPSTFGGGTKSMSQWLAASAPPSSPGPSRRATQTEAGREPTIDGGGLDPVDPAEGGAAGPPHQQYQPLMPGMRSLDLTDAGISSHNVAHLADLVRQFPGLEQLVLDFNSLSSAAGAATAAAVAATNNSTVSGDGSATAAPDATSQLFIDLAALPSLSYLSLNYACDGGAMIALADYLLGLAAAAPPPSSSSSTSPAAAAPEVAANLRVLSLVGCPLDGIVARRLARALMHNTSLAVLRLGGGDPPEGVGPIGSRALAEALTSHHGLVDLSLSGVGLTDNAARMFADALPQLPLLCKLDLSYNSLTGYGVEALAGAMLARNRNAVGGATEYKLSMQIHGNRISDELDARMQALSVPTSMTHAAERMPAVPRYGPPPPRGGSSLATAINLYGGGNSALVGRGGAGGAHAAAAGGGSPSRTSALPPPPILVPPPTIVRAPLPKQGPPPPLHAKGPRCAWSPPRSAATGTTASPTGATTPLGAGKTTALTAAPPPPPSRRNTAFTDDSGGGGGASVGTEFGRLSFTTNNMLTKIYGGGMTSGSGHGDHRGSPNGGGARPATSPAPRTLPMGLGHVRPNAPGAPYAMALVTSEKLNPLLTMNRRRPTAGHGAADGGHAAGTLPAVRQSWPAQAAGGEGAANGGGGSGGGASAEGEKPAPKVYGASEHLTQRIKCHMPDWVQRMQEDYYRKISSPSRPAPSNAPPPGPPSEHLSRPLLCHDQEWQKTRMMEQVARETAPEPHPKPVPGAPTTAGMVSSVALIQRGATSPPPRSAPAAVQQQQQQQRQRRAPSPRDSDQGAAAAAEPPAPLEDETESRPPAVESGDGDTADAGGSQSETPAPAGGVAALLAGLAASGKTGSSGNLASEESMEVVAVRNTGRRKNAIEVMRIKKAKSPGEEGGVEGPTDGGEEEGGGEEGGDDEEEDGDEENGGEGAAEQDGDSNGEGEGRGEVEGGDGEMESAAAEEGREAPADGEGGPVGGQEEEAVGEGPGGANGGDEGPGFVEGDDEGGPGPGADAEDDVPIGDGPGPADGGEEQPEAVDAGEAGAEDGSAGPDTEEQAATITYEDGKALSKSSSSSGSRSSSGRSRGSGVQGGAAAEAEGYGGTEPGGHADGGGAPGADDEDGKP